LSSLTAHDIARCAVFASLMAAGAFVTIPIGPVPVTLQVFFVLLAGMTLGPRLALLSVTAYLALGLVAPVYAGGALGVGVLFGPTGGYLIAFAPATTIAGWVAHRHDRSFGRLLLSAVAGLAPIYALGPAWLATQGGMTVSAAMKAGLASFMPVDLLKAGLAAAVAWSLVNPRLGLLATQRHR